MYVCQSVKMAWTAQNSISGRLVLGSNTVATDSVCDCVGVAAENLDLGILMARAPIFSLTRSPKAV